MSTDHSTIEEAAAYLFHLQVQRQTAAGLPPEISPRSLDDAYAIQDTLHETAGWPIGVLKVGCTSDAARQHLQLDHPIAGRIPADCVSHSPASIPRSQFGPTAPLIECEFAIQVDADGETIAVAPAIELVNPRIVSSGGFGGLATIADNSAACAVVLGAPIAIADAGDLTEHSIELRSAPPDDSLLATGSAAAVLGGPAESVRWALAHEAARGRRVPARTWIITGTCTGITPAEFTGRYRADYGRLGQIDFHLE